MRRSEELAELTRLREENERLVFIVNDRQERGNEHLARAEAAEAELAAARETRILQAAAANEAIRCANERSDQAREQERVLGEALDTLTTLLANVIPRSTEAQTPHEREVMDFLSALRSSSELS